MSNWGGKRAGAGRKKLVAPSNVAFEGGQDGYGSGDNTAPWNYMFSDHAPTKRPGDDDPFGQLMFDKGMSSNS